MFKAAKAGPQKAITANRLDDGRVVFLDERGVWTHHLADALFVSDGPALDEGGRDPFSYNVVFYNYLGRTPQFRTIDRQAIVDPPVSDYKAQP